MMSFYVIMVLTAFIARLINGQHLLISEYSKGSHKLCDVSERIRRTCSWKETKSRSIVQCVSLCSSKKACIGASVDENGDCFHHRQCPMVSTCTVVNDNHKYYTTYCVHGTWNINTYSCDCDPAFQGPRCNQGFPSCGALNPAGYAGGIHRVYLDLEQDGTNLFPVVCRIDSTGWYDIILFRNNGRGSFNRTWEEYVQGFYEEDLNNFWAGFNTWQKLLDKGITRFNLYYRMLIDLNNNYNRLYGVFDFVGGKENNYRFTYNNSQPEQRGSLPSMTFENCLKSLEPESFSTWDRDNDRVDGMNCASRNGVGWWFGDSCDYECNFLGLGFDYWDTAPSYQLWSAAGLDMDILRLEGDFEFMFVLW